MTYLNFSIFSHKLDSAYMAMPDIIVFLKHIFYDMVLCMPFVE